MGNSSRNIHLYDVERDEQAIVELWQATVGQLWPLSAKRIRQILAGPMAQHFVWREEDEIAGFMVTFQSYRGQEKVGRLALLLVTPRQQGKGIGTQLHDSALDYFKNAGIHAVQLGSVSPRFWCGVPGNLPLALNFFQKRGWKFADPVYDLIENLQHYVTPVKIAQRMAKKHIAIASNTHIAEVLAFEAQEFPEWLPAYKQDAELGDYQDILVAWDEQERVVGTLLLSSAASHPQRTDMIWQGLLGDDAGTIGAVGVADAERGRGIGIALVARGSEILKERGVGICSIDWVVLTDFYAKVGYEKWRDYYIGWREI